MLYTCRQIRTSLFVSPESLALTFLGPYKLVKNPILQTELDFMFCTKINTFSFSYFKSDLTVHPITLVP